MKKLLFSLLVILLGIGIVKADVFNYEFDWKNDDVSIKAIETFITVKDGYLVGGYVNAQDSYLIKLDKDGKEVAHVNLDGDTIVGLYEYGNYYYAIEDDYWEVMVYKLRKTDLSVVDKLITPAERNGWYYIIDYKDSNIYLTTLTSEVYAGWYNTDTNGDELLMKIDLNEFDYSFVNFNYGDDGKIDFTEYKKAFSKEYHAILKELDRGRTPIDVQTNGEYNVVVGRNTSNMLSGGYVAVYDKDNNFIKEYNASGSTMYYTKVLIKDNYILAVGPNHNKIDIFDFNAKLLKSIDLSNEYEGRKAFNIYGIVGVDGGFSAAYWVCDLRDDGCSENCIPGIRNYEILYNINVKTDGNGTVTASKTAEFGNELVTFTVTPKEGYVLSVVKVTDMSGNVLEFTDNKFTMPYADVLIEATFVPVPEEVEQKNPETISGAIIFGALIVVFASLSVGIYSFRKAKGLL